MDRRISLAGLAIISCVTWAAAQAPSPPPTPPAGQAPTRPAGHAPDLPVDHKSAQPADHSNKTADASFIRKAAIGGMAEVDLGQLASSKASDDKVKAFAQRMVTDHGKANDELKMLAASKQIEVPSALDRKHEATHVRLNKMSGSAFDRAYISDMLADHKKDVAEFMHQSNAATDPEVKAWVTKTLPTLQEHLKMIEGISKDIHVTANGSTK